MAEVLMWRVVNILRDAPLLCEAIIEGVESAALDRALEDRLVMRQEEAHTSGKMKNAFGG